MLSYKSNHLHATCVDALLACAGLVLCRDIKPENVLFGTNMVLKIADFGLAVNLREEPAVTRVGASWDGVLLPCM